MRYLIAALGASALLASAPVFAADDAPAFEKGPVWDFAQIKTIDGHFDDYMKWVSTEWKAQQEALKKAGRIIDYKVYIVADPRQGEPDIILVLLSHKIGDSRFGAIWYLAESSISESECPWNAGAKQVKPLFWLMSIV
jgi:hypothetical protein